MTPEGLDVKTITFVCDNERETWMKGRRCENNTLYKVLSSSTIDEFVNPKKSVFFSQFGQ